MSTKTLEIPNPGGDDESISFLERKHTDSLLLGCSELIPGAVELLHPVAALVSAVFQLLLQGADGRVHTQPLRLDSHLRLK